MRKWVLSGHIIKAICAGMGVLID